MNVSKLREKVKCRSVVMLGLLVLVAACAFVATVEIGPTMFKFHVEASLGVLPPGATPLPFKAKLMLPGQGTFVVDVYDTNGDGEGDVGGPVGPDNKYYKGKLEKIQPDVALGSGGARSAVPSDPVHDLLTFTPYWNPAAPSMPVVFQKSAADYLADYGIDHVAPGDNLADDLVEVLGGKLDAGLPSGFALDVRLHWNMEAGWTDIEQFPSLKYEFAGLPDRPGTWPHYMVARVSGDAGAVLNWLAHLGITAVDCDGIDIWADTGEHTHVNHLGITITGAGGLAQLDVDGVISYLSLGW